MRGTAGALILVLLNVLAAIPASAQVDPYRSLGVEWTASGDDGDVGRAVRYDLRYSTAGVGTDTLGWWNAASRATGLRTPSNPGQTDSARVSGLIPGTTYHFILRTMDDAGLVSGFSNVASSATLSCAAPAAAPQQFTAVDDSSGVNLSWLPTTDPLAVFIHLYRGAGVGGALSLLASRSASETSYRDLTALPGSTYRYAAAWASPCGDGPSSAPPVELTLPPSASAGPSDGSSLKAFPNPSSGPIRLTIHVAGGTPQPVRIRVFDMNGHLVADIFDGILPSGDTPITWDRVSRSGGQVVPGYYEVLGTIGSKRVRERIVLVP